MNRDSQSILRTRLLSIAVLLATFAAGIAVGFGAGGWNRPLHHRPPPPPRGPLGMPSPIPGLNLSAEQRQTAEAIADRHRPALEEILHGVFPEVRRINEQMERELRSILSPSQREKLDDFKRRHPPGPPHRPRPPRTPESP